MTSRWVVGIVVALTLHAGAAALVPLLFAHVPPEQGAVPTSRLALNPTTVPRSDASVAEPQRETAGTGQPVSQPSAAGVVRTARVEALANDPDAAAAVTPTSSVAASGTGDRLAAQAAPIPRARTELAEPIETSVASVPDLAGTAPVEASPSSESANSALVDADTAVEPSVPMTDIASSDAWVQAAVGGVEPNSASAPLSPVPSAVAPQSQALAQEASSARATVRPASLGLLPSENTEAAAASVQQASVVSTPGIVASSSVTVPDPTASVRPKLAALIQAEPTQLRATQQPLPRERRQAVLAWTGDVAARLSQATVATASALSVPAGLSGAQDIRDRIGDSLSSVRCARLRTEFDPETGAIALLGHVMTPTDAATATQALQQQLDGALPVSNQLRLLGAPQCEVLSALGTMPIPQSVEQFVDPRVIGDDLQARTFTFSAGELLAMTLQGADYDGWLYLDYYDSEGTVAHLVPNSVVAPTFVEAASTVRFGGAGADDITQGQLQIRISPPFGQDIAVAMVSSEPLFENVRPNFEPAESYLVDLEQRLKALQSDPGFRAEWVYLFIETLASR